MGPLNTHTLAVGDFDEDGKLDIAAISNLMVYVLLGDGAGSFAAATGSPFATGGSPFGVAIGDMNGDGKLDLVTANQSSNDVSVLLGDGMGGFGSATSFGAGTQPFMVTIGDVNRDGKPDLAVANATSNNVSVLLNTTAFTPAGGFRAPTNLTVGLDPTAVAVADLNLDGKLDLTVANASRDTFRGRRRSPKNFARF